MGSSLSPEEEQRLLRCIGAIDDPECAPEALRTLQNFLQGSPVLIPQLAAAKFGLFPALVGVMEKGAELPLATAVTSFLVSGCRPNCQAILRVRGSTAALAGVLGRLQGAVAAGEDAEAAMVAAGAIENVCSVLLALLRYNKFAVQEELATAETVDAVSAIAASVARRCGQAGWDDGRDMGLQQLLQLITDLVPGSEHDERMVGSG